MLQNNPSLKSKIDQLWNKFWAGGIANPLTAIEQITYLLFMKRMDDLDLKQQADAEFTGENLLPDLRAPGCRPNTGIDPKKSSNLLRSKRNRSGGANSLEWPQKKCCPTFRTGCFRS